MNISIDELRDIIAIQIAKSIVFHRHSRKSIDDDYSIPESGPTESEIDDFISSNALYDLNFKKELINPGIFGFQLKYLETNEQWIDEFKEQTESWSSNKTWLGADEPWYIEKNIIEPINSEIWLPNYKTPYWISTSPSYLLLAYELIDKGKLLNEMSWREFENLIGHLLEKEGWIVDVTKATRDGGVDVIASKTDKEIGLIKTIWQAKKYALKNKVKLKEIRELKTVREDELATKALIVTTSHLTRDAIEYIRKDKYRLDYKDNEQLIEWIKDIRQK
jgi:restriction system protein